MHGQQNIILRRTVSKTLYWDERPAKHYTEMHGQQNIILRCTISKTLYGDARSEKRQKMFQSGLYASYLFEIITFRAVLAVSVRFLTRSRRMFQSVFIMRLHFLTCWRRYVPVRLMCSSNVYANSTILGPRFSALQRFPHLQYLALAPLASHRVQSVRVAPSPIIILQQQYSHILHNWIDRPPTVTLILVLRQVPRRRFLFISKGVRRRVIFQNTVLILGCFCRLLYDQHSKVKFTLQQATKAQRWRCIAVLFL